MIDVTHHWWHAVAIAAACGLVGGLTYEFLAVRRGGQAGMIELPGRGSSSRLRDTGFLASMFLGAVASVVFLAAYQPTNHVSNAVTTREYEAIRFLAVSVLVGSVGSSVLNAMGKAATRAAEAVTLSSLVAGLAEVKDEIEAANAGGMQPETNARLTAATQKVEALSTRVQLALTHPNL